jgi:hypothetical protein
VFKDLMAEPRSFADVVVSTARQKLAAARARQHPDAAAEKPRDAILDGLQMIAKAIEDDGYVFSPSGPKFARRCGDFTFQIGIQSDRNNVAGQRAAIWVHASVYSRAFTAWTKKHSSEWIRPKAPLPLPIFGMQLGYVCEPDGWMEWDFAEKSNRRFVADDLVASIRAGAYPLFSAFEAGIDQIACLADREWPSPEGVLSYLIATGHADLAGETMRRFLDRRPDLKDDFERLRHDFAQTEVPYYRAGLTHDLAAFAVATGYPWKA